MRKPSPLAIHIVGLAIWRPFSWQVSQGGRFANIERHVQENREG